MPGQKRWQDGHPKRLHRLQAESREELPQSLEQAARGSGSGCHTELWDRAKQVDMELLLRKQRGSR